MCCTNAIEMQTNVDCPVSTCCCVAIAMLHQLGMLAHTHVEKIEYACSF
jgi:hypothetical protein